MGATEPTKEQKFLEQQYTALRTEIEQASDRAFKIFAASVLVVPTGLSLGAAAGNNVLPVIKLLLPLLLLAFYAMYSAQMFSTRRAGLYIESYIEPILLERTRGWESWVSERRYAYDSQMNVAFFSLSIVYYIGAVFVAVTAEVTRIPFFGYLESYPLSKIMLFIFYALAGLVMILLVLLVPLRQLKEEETIEQVYDKPLQGTPEGLQEQLIKKIEDLQPNPKCWRPLHFKDQGLIKRYINDQRLIKRYNYHTETEKYRPISRDVRLTIGEGLKNSTMLVGILTMIALFLWAAMPIYSLSDRLLQPTGIVIVLTVVLALFFLVLLFILYYYFIGRNLGPKIDIIFRRSSQAADSVCTRAIVQTSLDKERYKWLTEEILKDMKLIAVDKRNLGRES